MVNILEAFCPLVTDSSISLKIDGMFIFPVKWLYFNYQLENLYLTKSVSEIRKSSKMTDKILIELLSDFNFMSDFDDFDYEYILNSWNYDKQWRGMGPSRNEEAMLTIKLEERPVVKTRYNCVYELTGDGGIRCTCDAANEFSYNQRMLDFFGSKFPIELKSLAPMHGEDAAFL